MGLPNMFLAYVTESRDRLQATASVRCRPVKHGVRMPTGLMRLFYLIVYQPASDSGRLEMRSVVRPMANAWTVSIDWSIDPRIIATKQRGNEIVVGT